MSRFHFRARSTRGAASDVYAELEAAAIAAARANNAALWYIGRDLTGVFEDSAGATPAVLGGPVGLLRDRQYGIGSGSGYGTSQATAANKPTLVALANGLMALQFDGVNDFLSTSSNFVGSNVSPYTLIAAGAVSASAATTGFREILSDGRGLAFDNNRFTVLHASTGRFGAGAAGSFPPGSVAALSAVYAGSGGTLTARRNGTIEYAATTAAPITVSAGMFIGQRNNAAEYWWGTVSLACACSGQMSDAHRTAIERFASHLAGAAYAG